LAWAIGGTTPLFGFLPTTRVFSARNRLGKGRPSRGNLSHKAADPVRGANGGVLVVSEKPDYAAPPAPVPRP
jgi:hypothetical protein